MTVNFPSSPSQGDTYTYEAITYTFDGEKWVGSTASSFNDVTISGASANVILQGNDSITTDQTFTFNDKGGQLVPYQQGTGTPYFVSITNAYADALSSYQSQTMTWARVGNLVSFNLYCEAGAAWSLTNGAVGGNYVGINGLPYHMVAGAGSGYPSCTIGYWNKMAWTLLHQDTFSGGNPVAYLGSESLGPTVGLAYPTYASSGQDVARITFTDSVWKANSAIQISGQYITDDTTWVPVDGAVVS